MSKAKDPHVQEYAHKLFTQKEWRFPLFLNSLKNLREQLNVSRVELAKRIGVSDTTLLEWERGRYFPSEDSQYKIAAFLYSIDKGPSSVSTQPVVQVLVDPAAKNMIPCPQEGYVSWALTQEGQCYQVQMPLAVYQQIKIEFTSHPES